MRWEWLEQGGKRGSRQRKRITAAYFIWTILNKGYDVVRPHQVSKGLNIWALIQQLLYHHTRSDCLTIALIRKRTISTVANDDCLRYKSDFLPLSLNSSCPFISLSPHSASISFILLCIPQPVCPLLFIWQTWVREQEIALLFYEGLRFLGSAAVFCVWQSPLALERELRPK